MDFLPVHACSCLFLYMTMDVFHIEFIEFPAVNAKEQLSLGGNREHI